jgi:hypothetical protein
MIVRAMIVGMRMLMRCVRSVQSIVNVVGAMHMLV